MWLVVDLTAEIYQFTIVLIFVVALTFFAYMYWYSVNLARTVREQEQMKQSLQVNALQLERTRLQNLALEAETRARNEETLRLTQLIELKNQELVSSSMLISEQDRILSDIRNRVLEIEKKDVSDLRTAIRQLSRHLRSNSAPDQGWKLFLDQFETVHPDFFSRLEAINPQLSTNDLRHCAFIRMRIATKEIASMLNISPTSVQIARVRLKKKLGLVAAQDLRHFILKI